MAKYPIFLDLTDRRTVVIGAGNVAIRKAQSLRDAGARVVIIADKAGDTAVAFCADNDIELVTSSYTKSYLSAASLVIAATNDSELNSRIYKDCQEQEILCNVVDQPHLCDFYVPALVQRGSLQIAIGTDGACPAYAGHLRRKLQEQFTEDHSRFMVELEAVRKKVIENLSELADRKSLLGKLVDDQSFDYFIKNGSAAWHDRADKLIAEFTT